MSNKISISTARKTYEIENERGELLGTISIDPFDTGLVKRFESASADITAYVDGTLKDNNPDNAQQQIEKINALRDLLVEKLNFIVGCDLTELFTNCSPISIVPDGDFFFEKVLEAIGNIIEQETGAGLKKRMSRVRSATAKYNRRKK